MSQSQQNGTSHGSTTQLSESSTQAQKKKLNVKADQYKPLEQAVPNIQPTIAPQQQQQKAPTAPESSKQTAPKKKLNLRAKAFEEEDKIKEKKQAPAIVVEDKSKEFKPQPRKYNDIKEFCEKGFDFAEFLKSNSEIAKLPQREYLHLKANQYQGRQSVIVPGGKKGPYQPYKPKYQQQQQQNQTQQVQLIKTQSEPAQVLSSIDRGSQVQQPVQQVIVQRMVEDVSVKYKKDEMKKNFDWLSKVQDQGTEEKIKFLKDLKFRLNQIAPDNADKIIQLVLDLISKNYGMEQDAAEIIMEKAQVEPRYRQIYTQICKSLVSDERLMEENGKRNRFKTAILNSVQKSFESDSKLEQEKLEKLDSEALKIELIRKKNKVLGNVRFIGDLFKVQVIPLSAIHICFQTLFHNFRKGYLEKQGIHENPEDQLEGIIELVDQIGQYAENKKNKKICPPEKFAQFLVELKECFETQNSEQQLEENLSIEQIFQTLEFLVENVKISSRIGILIQNLRERQKNNWVQLINQRNESAKSKAQIYEEQDEEQYQNLAQKEKESKDRKKKKQEQKFEYVQKSYVEPTPTSLDKKESSQDSPVKQEISEKDLKNFVAETFQFDKIKQFDELKTQLEYMSNSEQRQGVFWEAFFNHLLEPKKVNLLKAQMVYDLLIEGQQYIEVPCFINGLKSKFREDYIYDLLEGGHGQELFQKMLEPFVLNKDQDRLLMFKFDIPQDIFGEFKYFIYQVAIAIKEENNIDDNMKSILDQYLIKTLGFKQEEL